MKGKIRVVRTPITERKNTYVRWDDYGEGDSELTGGEVMVRGYKGSGLMEGKTDKKSGIKSYGLKKSVEKGVMEWCKKYLPSETGWEGINEPGWEIWFEIDGKYARPVMTEEIKKLLLEKAAKQFNL